MASRDGEGGQGSGRSHDRNISTSPPLAWIMLTTTPGRPPEPDTAGDTLRGGETRGREDSRYQLCKDVGGFN